MASALEEETTLSQSSANPGVEDNQAVGDSALQARKEHEEATAQRDEQQQLVMCTPPRNSFPSPPPLRSAPNIWRVRALARMHGERRNKLLVRVPSDVNILCPHL